MDFSHNNRTNQPAVETPAGINNVRGTDGKSKRSRFSGDSNKWLRVASVVL